MQCSKQHPSSITWSARASGIGGEGKAELPTSWVIALTWLLHAAGKASGSAAMVDRHGGGHQD